MSRRQRPLRIETMSYLTKVARIVLLALSSILICEARAMEISNIVRTDEMAAELAEVYISNIYGKPAAERQKPYVVSQVDGYWQVKGVMQKRQLGGTFEIHIAKEDGRILLLTHSR